MPRRPPVDPTSATEVGKRLAQARAALGYTTTKMCELMGSSSNGSAYTNYESGRRLISLEHARQLRKYGFTLEWIYCGVIKAELSTRLQKLMFPQQRSRPSTPHPTPVSAS